MAAAAGGQASGPRPVTHKILGLVVHGVGEQTRGSTLRSFVQNFFPFIRTRSDVEKAGIDVRPIDDKQLPQVRLSFVRNSERYEILVQEVHWAEAFVAPSLSGVLGGVFELLTTWLRRALPDKNSAILRFWYLVIWFLGRLIAKVAAVLLMTMFAPLALLVALSALIAGWQEINGWQPLPGLIRIYARFQPSVVEIVVILLLPVLIALFIVLVILEKLGPLREFLPNWVGKVRTEIVSIATSHVGDVSVYCGQPWEASQMRTRFEKRFKDLVECEGEHAESMFVIAHSLGCPVSYESLSGRRMREFITKEFVRKKRPLYYFTVGSALPLIWRVIPDREKGRLQRKLPTEVYWEDFISVYDPIKSALIIDGVQLPQDLVSTPDVEHNVINQMDLLSEHSAYLSNAEEVLEPILKRINAI